MRRSKQLPISLTPLITGIAPLIFPHIEWIYIDKNIPLKEGSPITIMDLDTRKPYQFALAGPRDIL